MLLNGLIIILIPFLGTSLGSAVVLFFGSIIKVGVRDRAYKKISKK